MPDVVKTSSQLQPPAMTGFGLVFRKSGAVRSTAPLVWRDSLNAKVRRVFGEYERKMLGVGYAEANLHEALAMVIHAY